MGAVIVAVVYAVTGLVSIIPALFTPFLFDAPGSETSPLTEAFAGALLLLPLFFLAGGIFRLVLRRPVFFLLPGVDIAAIVAIVVAIQYYCGGSLACSR